MKEGEGDEISASIEEKVSQRNPDGLLLAFFAWVN
jgi:hypothetical protein